MWRFIRRENVVPCHRLEYCGGFPCMYIYIIYIYIINSLVKNRIGCCYLFLIKDCIRRIKRITGIFVTQQRNAILWWLLRYYLFKCSFTVYIYIIYIYRYAVFSKKKKCRAVNSIVLTFLSDQAINLKII